MSAYLRREDGKRTLSESFASEEIAMAIEGKVASYLLDRSREASW